MLHAVCCWEEAGARNLVFFRVKWLQPALEGTSCVRRVRLGSFCARIGSSSVFCNKWLFLRTSFYAFLESQSSPAAATLHGKTQGFVLRLPPHNIAHATFMQPFQCDPQPEIQETHRTTYTGTTTCCRTQRRNRFAHKTTPAAPAAHTRYLSSPAAATLHGKTQGFVLQLPPHNTRHATFMQPFQCDLQPQLQETHYHPSSLSIS